MADGDISITLSRDQAIVLSDWLDRRMVSAEFAAVVDDRAAWSPLLRIAGSLETQLVEIFQDSYGQRLDEARARLIPLLGDFGA
ncbi:hypothetical protein [Catellatospora sichuanensis]|uniref:hypothetical protein n=1 Tax=Catellatospora sichuanensis TaxID=1969805 RepID=UPI001C920686|nr:hypothetical protein [Catellatospora sichuanensis]